MKPSKLESQLEALKELSRLLEEQVLMKEEELRKCEEMNTLMELLVKAKEMEIAELQRGRVKRLNKRKSPKSP